MTHPRYSEALDWLYSRQMFGIKLGLENPRALLEAMGNPDRCLRFLHVAGTNGKGSVCAFSDSILRQQGWKTGLFTSPHLVDFRERIRLNGAWIPQSDVESGLNRLRALCEREQIAATFFELVLVLAVDWFARQGAEIVVLETGMGGRLDATNVVDPEVSVITPVAMDHQQWLGEDLATIAGEKAGIIKPGRPTVAMPQEPAAMQVLERAAAEKQASFFRIAAPFLGTIPLPGPHQAWNAAAAATACKIVDANLADATIASGIAETHWSGRFEILDHRIVVDCAHNPHATRALLQTWHSVYPNQKFHLVFGCLRDKDPRQLLDLLLPFAEGTTFVPVRSPRGVPPTELQAMVQGSSASEDLPSAISPVRHSTKILVCGSLFLAGEALAILRGRPPARISRQ